MTEPQTATLTKERKRTDAESGRSYSGGILLAKGVAVAIIHYVVENDTNSGLLTLAVAAVLLLVGWTLFDRGAGTSRRWHGNNDRDDG
jgi:hypothetical protein